MSAASASTSVDLVRATREQLDELDDLLERMLGLPVKPEPNTPEPDERKPEKKEPPPGETYSMPTPAQEKEPESFPATVENRPAPERGEQQDDSWVPLRSTWQPSPQTWGPLARTWRKLSAKDDVEMPEEAPPPREFPSQPAARQVDEEPVRAEMPKVSSARDEQPTFPSLNQFFPGRDADSVEDRPWAASKEESADHTGDTIKQTLSDALARLRKSETPLPEPHPRAPLWTWPLLAVDRGFEWITLPLGPVGRWFRGAAGRELMAWLGVLAFVAAATLMALDGFGWTW